MDGDLYDTTSDADDLSENGRGSTEQTTTRLNDGDELEIATPEDFNIKRNEAGELLPVKQRIPGSDKAIKVKPLSGGVREEYNDVLSSNSADAERIAELWQDRIVEGVGKNATPEEIENVYPYGLIAGINQALKNSSGEDIFLAVQEQQTKEMKANAEMMDMMGEDVMMRLLKDSED